MDNSLNQNTNNPSPTKNSNSPSQQTSLDHIIIEDDTDTNIEKPATDLRNNSKPSHSALNIIEAIFFFILGGILVIHGITEFIYMQNHVMFGIVWLPTIAFDIILAISGIALTIRGIFLILRHNK